MTSTRFSLSEFNRLIRKEISAAFPSEYWIMAETSDVRYNQTGHCYLELIERQEPSGSIIAKARAYIWSNTFMLLRPYFEEKTGQRFTSGIKVLVKLSVDFHPLYGMGLSISDIDPAYTLGDIQQRRQQILRQLEEEGIIGMNKELDFPLIPQRIAIITSPTAAGYEDFLDHLQNNLSGFVFYPHLFPAVMQGEGTERSIIAALESIYNQQDRFDVVVIIRGGGATSDLAAFDSYLLGSHCAQFPLPIITGIGHERDNTVLDYVAYHRAKTPTAVADFLIDKTTLYYNRILAIQQYILEAVQNELSKGKERLQRLSAQFPIYIGQLIERESYRVETLCQYLQRESLSLLQGKRDELERAEAFFKLSSPDYILGRGYSIVYKDGKAVKSVEELTKGDVIETSMVDGSVGSVVTTEHRQSQR